MQGYIKDYRKELDSDIWLMPPLYHRVWQWLKYSVNHTEKKIPMVDGSKLTVRKGQRLTSIRNVAREVGWYERGRKKEPNPKTISTVLKWLETQNMISVDRGKGNSQYTLITLINWDLYQSNDEESNSKVTVKKQSADINKNEKNEKNDKKKQEEKIIREIKDLRASFSPDLIQLVDTYWSVLKKTRKTNTISYSVILKTMKQWTKFDPIVIKYALKKHIEVYDDGEKKENYTLAIMKNTKPEKARDELDQKVTQFRPRKGAPNYDEPPRSDDGSNEKPAHIRLYK